MTGSVWAIVVTYNRQALLQQCLQALVLQTRPCDQILVVDNASTDGTAEMLDRDWKGKLKVLRLATNTGGAGGFHAGMKHAIESGADQVWLMDDDVVPTPNALEALIECRLTLKQRNIEYSYLCSLVRTPSGDLTNVPDVDWRTNTIGYQSWADLLGDGMVAVRRATFVSILFERDIVEKYGLPLAEMFLWGDDTEYTTRISAVAAGYQCGKSVVCHIRFAPGVIDIRSESDDRRISFHGFLVRNTILLKRRHFGKREALNYAWAHVKLAIYLLFRGDIRRFMAIYSGLYASLRFSPHIEYPVSRPDARVRAS